MSALDVILAVAFAGALAGLAFLSVYFVPLRGLLHKYGTFQCALRRKGGRWIPGIIALQADAIEWYPRRSLVLNSKWSFPRELLEIRGHRQGMLPGTTVVEFLGDGVEYEAALGAAQFAGLVSWIDSAPPAEEPADF